MNYTGSALQMENSSQGLVLPTIAPSWSGRGNSSLANTSGSEQIPVEIMGTSSVAPSNSNVLWLGAGYNVNLDPLIKDLGRLNNVRA